MLSDSARENARVGAGPNAPESPGIARTRRLLSRGRVCLCKGQNGLGAALSVQSLSLSKVAARPRILLVARLPMALPPT